MIKISQFNNEYELYTYNELSESSKTIAVLSNWIDLAEYYQSELQRGNDPDIEVPNTWEVLAEYFLAANIYELIPYFDYNDKGKVIWATCSFETEDIFSLLDYKSEKYLKEKYNIQYSRDSKVNVHYIPKSTHPIIELTEVELKIPNEREFVDEYMSIVEEEAQEKLDKLNEAMATDIQKYLDDWTDSIISEYESYLPANSLTEFISKNNETSSTFTLFELNGKPITVYTDHCQEL